MGVAAFLFSWFQVTIYKTSCMCEFTIIYPKIIYAFIFANSNSNATKTMFRNTLSSGTSSGSLISLISGKSGNKVPSLERGEYATIWFMEKTIYFVKKTGKDLLCWKVTNRFHKFWILEQRYNWSLFAIWVRISNCFRFSFQESKYKRITMPHSFTSILTITHYF